MKCSNCGNKHNLKKVTFKDLPRQLEAFICPRCWTITLKLSETNKTKLLNKWAKEDLKKAKKLIK